MSSGLLIAIAALGLVVIGGLAFYAGKLLFQLKQQQRKEQAFKEKAVELSEQRQIKLVEDIQYIAKAVNEKQCELSEGSLRICVLMQNLTGYEQANYQQDYPSMFKLYDTIKAMPTHQARMDLPKKERRQQDKQRFLLEMELGEAIFSETEKLLQFQPKS